MLFGRSTTLGLLLLVFGVFCFYPPILDAHEHRFGMKAGSFRDAAKQNAELRYALKWTFGRKAQRGWFLYTALIQKTVENEASADSEGFAESISKWQKRNRLPVTGLVDKKTLFSLIKHWQSRRIKPIRIAKEYQLLSAPISDFFDPTRDSDLLKVENETYKAYKRLIGAAVADKSLGLEIAEDGTLSEEEKFLKIVSSYRSPAYQASLRKKQPGASRAQIAFTSPHFTGKALDIYVGGEPVTTKDFNRAIQVETPVYKWLVTNAEKFGFQPYFYEPWHWEYVPEASFR